MDKKKTLLITSIIVCILFFTIPFIIRNDSDSWMSVIGTAFTSLGAVATFITLLIAIFLYNKFSLDNKFLEYQTLKVLELADYLKGKTININTESFVYYLRFNIDNSKLENESFYKVMKTRTILINYEDFDSFVDPLLEIKRSYWLPKEIKEKLEFLNLFAICEMDNEIKSETVKVYLKKENKNNEFGIPLPKMTVEEFINNKNRLVQEIHNWINKYSEIKIDLKLEEAERYISKEQ